MTTQTALSCKRQNKGIRYSQCVSELQESTSIMIPFNSPEHVRFGGMVVNVIQLGDSPKLSEGLPQANVLKKRSRPVRIAELSEAMRMMLRSTGQTLHDWRALGADGLLARINNPRLTPRDREMAVLFAETTAFDGARRERLLTELAKFISANRFTRDHNAITAVGSAIRKYAMNMDESRFELYGRWLRPSETETLSSYVELELVKALCWRLSYLQVSAAVTCPGLMAALVEVTTAYLSPRWIVDKNYAAVALQSVTAIAVLQALFGDRTAIDPLLERVSALGLDWFSELLEDRLEETYEAISQHDAQLAEQLRQLIDRKP